MQESTEIVAKNTAQFTRCSWCGTDPQMIEYHDNEWGVPQTDSRSLFDKLMLDAFQAGLSWRIVLIKRDALRSAFAGFDPNTLARWSQRDIDTALDYPGIIRNRAKANAAVTNSIAWLQVEADIGFARLLWEHVGMQPITTEATNANDIPTSDHISTSLSKILKKRGFKFVGPVMVMAFMEAVGLRNHHLPSCAQRSKCERLGQSVPAVFA